MEWLKGKKTYIVAALVAILGFAEAVGWIDASVQETILTWLIALGLTSTRAGIAKSGTLVKYVGLFGAGLLFMGCATPLGQPATYGRGTIDLRFYNEEPVFSEPQEVFVEGEKVNAENLTHVATSITEYSVKMKNVAGQTSETLAKMFSKWQEGSGEFSVGFERKLDTSGQAELIKSSNEALYQWLGSLPTGQLLGFIDGLGGNGGPSDNEPFILKIIRLVLSARDILSGG